tara:strand:+ start:338 stop:910 length:573 start_codon:yes stop_codon:yes gene_type:complete
MPRKKGDRVKGSWRDQGKGECFTRTGKGGGKYVVCNDPPRGSRGQAGVYKSKNVRIGKAQTGFELKEKVERDKAIKKIQAGARGKQVRGKEVELSSLTRKGKKTAPSKSTFGDLFLEVKEDFGVDSRVNKKGLYKVKAIPSKEGTGSSNTQKVNVWMKGNSGEEAQFNPYTKKGQEALKEGKVRLIRKKI